MPLRDHFRPPVELNHSWDELHGMWPAAIVQQLFPMRNVSVSLVDIVTIRQFNLYADLLELIRAQ